MLNSDNVFVPEMVEELDHIYSKMPGTGLVFRRSSFGKGLNPGDKLHPNIVICGTLYDNSKSTEQVYKEVLEWVKVPGHVKKYPDGGPKDTSGADCMIFPTKIIKQAKVPPSIRGVCYDTNIIVGIMKAYCSRVYLPDLHLRVFHAHHKHSWLTSDPEWKYNQVLYFGCRYFIGKPPCRPDGLHELVDD
jgi:hypothetical protein